MYDRAFSDLINIKKYLFYKSFISRTKGNYCGKLISSYDFYKLTLLSTKSAKAIKTFVKLRVLSA